METDQFLNARHSAVFLPWTSERETMCSFIENVPCAIALFDLKLRYVAASRRWWDEFCMESEPPVGRVFNRAHQYFPQHLRRLSRVQAATRGDFCDEDVFVRANGLLNWVRWEARPWHLRDGEAGGVIVSLENITDQKKDQEALKAQSSFFRKVIDLAPYFIFAKDRQGRFTLVNKAVADAYGTTVEELTGKTDADFNPVPGEVEHFRNDDLEVMDSLQQMVVPEEKITDASGKVRYLHTVKLPIIDESGRAAQVLGASTDITELKQTEAQRCELEAQVRQTQKLESLGVLAGGIAHDFNNLLMGILGNAGLLLMRLPPDSYEHQLLERVRLAGERAAELTTQLLAYSGKGRFVVAPVDLSQIVREMNELLTAAISKKAAMHFEFASNLPLIEADVTQIRQVIMNLMINASEALEDRPGEIRLQTGVLFANHEYLSQTYLGESLSEGPYAFLEITDTGVGMSKEVLDKMFDPFFTTKFTGRGLGLAGVMGIVRSHRGALDVRSRPGQGTSFRVLFPASSMRAEPSGKLRRRKAGQELETSGLFLVVDDEPVTQTAAKGMLEHFGFEVLTAVNGAQGLELFSKHASEIRAVLLDLTMPAMDGREALAAIREINPDVPVILSSGYSEQEATRLMPKRSFDGFLHKPYGPEVLREKVEQVLRGR